MSRVGEVSRTILRELLADFLARCLKASDLHCGYEGASLVAIKEKCQASVEVSDVDFDLALRELEGANFIKTGPMVPYENDPNSSVFVLMLFSRYENAYLTVKGYTAAQQGQVKQSTSSAHRVHISGGHFHQSQIGIGHEVVQTQATSLQNSPVFDNLRLAIGEVVDTEHRAKILCGVDAMQNAKSAPELSKRYADFIALAANHMTIIAPFLPALSALLVGN